jgi:hypothetical protein
LLSFWTYPSSSIFKKPKHSFSGTGFVAAIGCGSAGGGGGAVLGPLGHSVQCLRLAPDPVSEIFGFSILKNTVHWIKSKNSTILITRSKLLGFCAFPEGFFELLGLCKTMQIHVSFRRNCNILLFRERQRRFVHPSNRTKDNVEEESRHYCICFKVPLRSVGCA